MLFGMRNREIPRGIGQDAVSFRVNSTKNGRRVRIAAQIQDLTLEANRGYQEENMTANKLPDRTNIHGVGMSGWLGASREGEFH